MKKEQINIRDPFVVYEDGIYYMYGTRAKNSDAVSAVSMCIFPVIWRNGAIRSSASIP